MVSPRGALLPFALPFLAGAWAWAQQQPAIPAEQAEVYALLDEVGFADAPQAPFVVVHVGPRQQSPPLYGELVASTKDRFTVLLLDLGRTTWAVGRDVPPECRATFEPIDLRVLARWTAGGLRIRTKLGQTISIRSETSPLSPETRALLIARACARRGFLAAAGEIWADLPREFLATQSLLASPSFAFDVETRLVLDHADPGMSWPELLTRHEKVIAAFGGAENPWWSSRRDHLRRRLERVKAVAIEATTAPERLARALCDQAAPAEWLLDAEPTRPRQPLGDYAEQPAERLVALGLDAVPALLEALGDESPTRSPVHSQRMGGSFHTTTVARVASACLQRIAGGCPPKPCDAAGWRDWYVIVRARGIAAAREEVFGVRAGCPNVFELMVRESRAPWGWQR